VQTANAQDFSPSQVIGVTRDVLLAIAAGIPLLLTLTVMGEILIGEKPLGPDAETIFRRIGFTASHGIPLGLIALALVGHAIRERSPEFAFAGGLVVKLLVGGGFAVAVVLARQPFDENAWIELGQRLTLTAAAWAVGWLV